MTDLVKLARQRIDDQQRTHWEGCERDHRECLIQRMADEIERLRALLREVCDRDSGAMLVAPTEGRWQIVCIDCGNDDGSHTAECLTGRIKEALK